MIYFVQCGPRGPIKIGSASNVENRLRGLAGASPQKLYLRGTIEGSFELERDLHEKFRDIRIRGEWFKPAQELLDFIANPTPVHNPKRYDTEHPLYKAWFSKEYESDDEMAYDWRMDADMLRAELGESGRPHHE